MGSNNVPTKTYSKRLLLFGIYIYLMSLLRLQKIFRMRDNSTDAILLFMAIFSTLNAFVVSIDTTRRRPLIFGTFEKQDRGEEALLLSSSSLSSSSSSRDTNTRS